MKLKENTRRNVFFLILLLTFIAIFIYNCLTPLLSDDIIYLKQVKDGNGFFDLFRQEYKEYFTNNARYFDLLFMRIFLYIGKPYFNIVNSLLFVSQLILLYVNIDRRPKYDVPLLLLLDGFLWLLSVDFGQTNLWLCGACNYLWSSVILLGNLTLVRHFIKKDREGTLSKKNLWLKAIGLFLFCMFGSWCSETFGAATLFMVFVFCLLRVLELPKGQRKIPYYMIASILGHLAGSTIILISPGVHNRASVLAEDESYTGIAAYLSRFYKVTINIYDTFLILLILFVLTVVYLCLKGRLNSLNKILHSENILFFVGFLAACYCIILIAPPMHRAYYGAAFYLMIAVGYGFCDLSMDNDGIAFIKYGAVSILTMLTLFTIVDNLINLKVIYTDEQTRINILMQAKEEGKTEEVVIIPAYHEGYDTVYSLAYLTDLDEDPDYWMNIAYEDYYGISQISCIPYDEWVSLETNQ